MSCNTDADNLCFWHRFSTTSVNACSSKLRSSKCLTFTPCSSSMRSRSSATALFIFFRIFGISNSNTMHIRFIKSQSSSPLYQLRYASILVSSSSGRPSSESPGSCPRGRFADSLSCDSLSLTLASDVRARACLRLFAKLSCFSSRSKFSCCSLSFFISAFLSCSRVAALASRSIFSFVIWIIFSTFGTCFSIDLSILLSNVAYASSNISFKDLSSWVHCLHGALLYAAHMCFAKFGSGPSSTLYPCGTLFFTHFFANSRNATLLCLFCRHIDRIRRSLCSIPFSQFCFQCSNLYANCSTS